MCTQSIKHTRGPVFKVEDPWILFRFKGGRGGNLTLRHAGGTLPWRAPVLNEVDVDEEIMAPALRWWGDLAGWLALCTWWCPARAVVEDGHQLGAQEVIRVPHPCPAVEDVGVLLMEGGAINLVEEAHFS